MEMDEDPLGVDLETMRRLGYQTVDLLVDRWVGLGEQPVLGRGTPAELASRLQGPAPQGPQSFERILEQLDGCARSAFPLARRGVAVWGGLSAGTPACPQRSARVPRACGRWSPAPRSRSVGPGSGLAGRAPGCRRSAAPPPIPSVPCASA
jgi:hypothetical protein